MVLQRNVPNRASAITAPSSAKSYDPENEDQFRRQVERTMNDLVNAVSADVPTVSSVTFWFDISTQKLNLRAVAGYGMESGKFEISEFADFSVIEESSTINVSPGDIDTFTMTDALALSRQDQVWYGRVTPYSREDAKGTEGLAKDASTYPAVNRFFVLEDPDEFTDDGTYFTAGTRYAQLTLIPVEGAEFDAITMATKKGDAAWSVYGPITADGSGNYVDRVELDQKHGSKIGYQVLVDTDGDATAELLVQQNVVTFDIDREAEVLSINVVVDGEGTATIDAKFDSDLATAAEATAASVPQAEYTLNSGSSHTSVVPDTTRNLTFTVSQTTSEQSLWLRGYNEDGVAGGYAKVKIPKYVTVDPPGPGIGKAENLYVGTSSFVMQITWQTLNDISGMEIRIDEQVDTGSGWSAPTTVLTGRTAVEGEDSYNRSTSGTPGDYRYRVRLHDPSTGQDVAYTTTNVQTI